VSNNVRRLMRSVPILMTAALLVPALLRGQPSPQPPTEPLSLAAVTSAALQQVSAFRQAQIDEAVAAEDLRQARTALLPRARDEFSFTYNSPARSDPSSPSFIGANAVRESQNLFGVTGDLSFGVVAAIRRGRALLEAARAGTAVARRALVRGAGEAYYNAASATAARQAAEESLAAAQEFERVTALNVDAGEVPEVDAIRARLQTAARRDELAQAQETETIANASLTTFLGTDAGLGAPAIEPLPQTIDLHELEALTPAGAAKRPEAVQLEAQVRAARAGVGVARAGRLPALTYSVDEGFDTGSLAPDELRQHRGVLAVAVVDVPLFDWGASRSRQRQAELRAEGAELQRQLTMRDLLLQFATARQQAATAAERAENARRALSDAERNASISVARYRAGEAPILEATDAQTTLAQQRLALQQALAGYFIAREHLREAAGE